MSMTPTMTLEFFGEATKDHVIDAKDLAPAMLHLAEAIERAGQMVAPDLRVKLNVRATSEGSFLVEFLLAVTNAWDKIVTLLTTPDGQAVGELVGIASLIVGVVGVTKSRARHGGRPTVAISSDGQEAELTYPDGIALTVPKRTVDVANDAKVSRALRAMLEPVTGEGIDSVELTHGSETVIVEASDVGVFGSGLTDDNSTIHEEVQRGVTLQFTDVTFRENGKWKVTDGTSKTGFYVTVEDQAFIDQVNEGRQRFGKRDIIVADLRRVYTVDDQMRLRADTSIIKVIRHLEPGELQPTLPE